MTTVTCSECKKETTVPFEPTAGRPVYCKECFAKKRTAGGPRGGPRRGGFQHDRPKTNFKRSDYPGFDDLN